MSGKAQVKGDSEYDFSKLDIKDDEEWVGAVVTLALAG